MSEQSCEVTRAGTVAIVGRPNVGKSTLLNRLVGEKLSITSRKAQTTRHRIHAFLTREDGVQFVFVDTPGFQKRHGGALNRAMNRTVTQALEDVDVVVFVVEAGKLSDEDRVAANLLPANRPVVLVVNKLDVIKDRERMLPFLASVSALHDFAAIVPLSAVTGYQTELLLDEVAKHLPAQGALYAEDELTDRNERFLASEFIREKLFRLLGEEVPYVSAVVIDRFVEENGVRKVYATIVVDRDSQKGIVIGKGGEKIKRIASEARVDMEKLFGGPVFLELWVKVKSGWADDERMVRSFGYE